jgi:hypothetical protein
MFHVPTSSQQSLSVREEASKVTEAWQPIRILLGLRRVQSRVDCEPYNPPDQQKPEDRDDNDSGGVDPAIR